MNTFAILTPVAVTIETKNTFAGSRIKRLVCDVLVRFFGRKRPGKEIVTQYFAENPAEMDGVKRATFAYHANHREAGAHYFAGSSREAPCRWCGQTREGVRWDWYGKPPTCEARPKWADESIESVIAREEKLFGKVLDRAKKLAKEIDVAALTGEELARLHHTHGVDPSMLEVALMADGRSLPQQLHDDYQRAYAEHRATGKRGLVREIIVAKTTSDLSNSLGASEAQPPADPGASTHNHTAETSVAG